MRSLYFLALATMVPSVTPAQALPDPSGLSVVRKQWQITRQAVVNPVLLEDPFEAVERTSLATRDPKMMIHENKLRSQKGLGPEPMPQSTEVPVNPERKTNESNTFTYQILIRNDGERTAKQVLWDYVFLDPVTKLEVGRHSFISSIDLRPTQTRNVSAKRTAPPALIVDATAAGSDAKAYIEQVVIKRVTFSDGSVWQPVRP